MIIACDCLVCISPWLWKDPHPELLEGHRGAILTNLTLLMGTKCSAAESSFQILARLSDVVFFCFNRFVCKYLFCNSIIVISS